MTHARALRVRLTVRVKKILCVSESNVSESLYFLTVSESDVSESTFFLAVSESSVSESKKISLTKFEFPTPLILNFGVSP